jgi:hypothetical protein
MTALRRLVSATTRFYGAHPVKLLLVLACFALAGYAALQVATDAKWPRILLWFCAAVIGHDLVLFPLYALVDRVAHRAIRTLPRPDGAAAVPLVNHVRLPLLGSGLLFLLFFPGIIQQGARSYLSATGKTQEPYLARWLLLCAGMFALSAVVYAVRARRASRPRRALVAVATAAVRHGERVLRVAADHDGRCAVALTRSAFYHRSDDDTWLRTSWADLDHVRRDDQAGTLVAGSVTRPDPVACLRLPAPGRLPAVAADLIAATVVTTTRVSMSDGHSATITARREPDTDRVHWIVTTDPALDAASPAVQADIDAAIHRISNDLGLPHAAAAALPGYGHGTGQPTR